MSRDEMGSVVEMLAAHESVQAILATMPGRAVTEQNEVWQVGLTKMAADASRADNVRMGKLIERVSQGQLSLLYDEPLDDVETWCKGELKLSRGRVKGELKRQAMVKDVLRLVAWARAQGAATIREATGTDG